MKLLVDIGNTRVKWATLEDGRLGTQHAAIYKDWSPDDWRMNLFATPGVDAVIAASVSAGPAAALDAATSGVTGRSARFVQTTSEAAGVRNAYRDPHLLGVDRWLAMIAAHGLGRGASCVADVGTAATFDAVAGDGRHLGGFIVPGPWLMVQSLHGGTADLAGHTAASGEAGETLFADNTRDAIERGCRLAVAALFERGVAETERQLGSPAVLLLTGGGAGAIVPLLGRPAEIVPDLVLRGLAVLSR